MFKTSHNEVRYAAALLVLAACTGSEERPGGDGGTNVPPSDRDAGTIHEPLPPVEAMIGAAGGTLELDEGVALVIPPNALAADTMIRVTDASGPRPENATGRVYEFEPAGLEFDVPAEIHFPLELATEDHQLFWSRRTGEGFDARPLERTDRDWRAAVLHFSEGYVGLSSRTYANGAAAVLSLGFRYGCFSQSNGAMRCFGSNQHFGGRGEEGSQNFGPYATNLVAGVPEIQTINVAPVGVGQTCAVTTSGELWCWGLAQNLNGGHWYPSCMDLNRVAPRRLMTGVRDVSVSGSGTCVALQNGTVQCWGKNRYGEQGLGHAEIGYPCAGALETAVGLTNVVQVSKSESRVCARTSSGAVFCWGNVYQMPIQPMGACREPTSQCSTRPQRLQGVSAIHIDMGTQLCLVRTGGTVSCWQDDAWADYSAPDPFVQVSRSCAVTSVGTVWCWGDNTFGQLGNGTTVASATPVQVLGLNNAIQVDVVDGFDGRRACALTTPGDVYCWGNNDLGFGDGTRTDSSVPVSIVW